MRPKAVRTMPAMAATWRIIRTMTASIRPTATIRTRRRGASTALTAARSTRRKTDVGCGEADEEESRGGRTHRRAAGGPVTVKAKHADIYETSGGTHHWKDAGDKSEQMKKGGGKWIAGAIKHPGALHKQLGVPQGEKIPAKKLATASHSSNPTLRKRANLAKTLKGFHH